MNYKRARDLLRDYHHWHELRLRIVLGIDQPSSEVLRRYQEEKRRLLLLLTTIPVEVLALVTTDPRAVAGVDDKAVGEQQG